MAASPPMTIIAIAAAIPLILLVILPFIAGLCGSAHRFVYIYLAILVAIYVASDVVDSFFLSDASSFIDGHLYKGATLADRLVRTLFGTIFAGLMTLAVLVSFHSCGRGLRALTLRIVRPFCPCKAPSEDIRIAHDRDGSAKIA